MTFDASTEDTSLVVDASAHDAGLDASVIVPLDSGADATTDLDSDGVPDATDNCPTTANPSQHDEDTDGRGDACDGCPHLSDPTQPDADGDGVNDACDPSPLGDIVIVSFLSFDGSPLPAAWRFEIEAGVTATSRIEGDELVLGPDARLAALLTASPTNDHCLVATEAVLDVIEPMGSRPARNFSIVDHYVPPLATEDALFTGPLDDIDDPVNANLRILVLEDGANLGSINTPEPTYGGPLATGIAYDLVYLRRTDTHELRTTRPIAITTSAMFVRAGGEVGIRVRGVTARFRYVVVIA